jgi:predicted CopG family antitoxin
MDFSVFNSEIDIEKIINKAEDGSKNIKNLIGRIFSPKVINNTDTFDLAVSVLKEITAEYPDTGNSFKKDFNITISDELYELLLTKKDVAVKMYEKRKKAS